MKGISTVGILILTVFLSVSVLPACADIHTPGPPVLVYGHVENGEDGTVKITANGDLVEVPVGNYGAPGCWITDLSTMSVTSGDLIGVTVTTADGYVVEDTKCIVDAFSPGGMAPAPAIGANGVSSSGGSSSGDGTYPPGWYDDVTPTPAPTPEPEDTPTSTSTDTTEPSSTTPDEKDAVTPTETATEDETDTKTLNTDPGAPGFGAVYMIAGLLAAMYLVLRRRE